MIKITKTIIALAAAGLLSFQAQGGTISYVPIPSTSSDTGAGISPDNVYTSAIEAGNATGTDRVVNGVTLTSLPGNGNTSTAGGITVNALSGSLSNVTGAAGNVEADGVLASAFQTMISNDGATDGSQQEIVLDPATLTSGKTYDLRVYISSSGNQDREVDLSFACDTQTPVETGFFNEDDATTSPGSFADKNQAYYINYRFTWDGTTTPGITITQKSGATPFLLYAVTNQEASATPTPQPAVDEAPVGSGPGQDVGVESDQFYDNDGLNSHGRWIIVGRYGRCWQPGGVAADWAPYTRGHWVHCNYGWTWITDQTEDDWGWATYHYGRWCRVNGAGWCWVPGRVWAPAWVSWRTNDSCVGWAPLPPDANCAPGVGISIWADSSYGLGPGAYNFVSVQNFGAPNLAVVLFPRQRNVEFIQSTANVTNIVNNNTVIYNGGPNVNTINAAIIHGGGTPIATGLMLSRRGIAGPLGGGKFSQLQGNTLTLAGPRVSPTKNLAGLKPAAATFATPKFDKGWSQVGDPKAATALKQKIALDAKGKTPKTTKAVLPAGVSLAPANVVAGAASPAGLHPGKAFKKAAAAGTPAPGGAPAGPLHPGQKLSQVVPAGQKGIPNTAAPVAKHPGQALNPAVVPNAQPTATPVGGFHPGQKFATPATAAVAQPTPTPKKHGKNAVTPVATPVTAAPALVHPGQTLPAAATNVAQPTPTPKKHGKQNVTPPPAPAPVVPNAVTAPQHTPVPKPAGPSLQQTEAAAAAKQQQQAAAAAEARQQQAGAAKQQQQAEAAAAAKQQQQAAAAAEARQQQQAGAAAAAKQQEAAALAKQQQAAAAAAAAARAAAARGVKPTPTPTPGH